MLSCKATVERSYSSKDPDRLKVLTTFTVLADIAKNIAGDRLDVQSITKPGAEIHGYKPTPSDLVNAANSDLILENGFGLELWAKKFISSLNKDIPTVVLSEGMEPLNIAGDAYKGKPNPHAWMSPNRALHYVDKIVKAFIFIDPEGKAIYLKNGQAYKQELLALDKELSFALKSIPSKKRILVSCEGALSYLAEDYGFEEAYLWPVNAESQVTPRRMERLIAKIRETKVPVIFCETTVSAKAQKEVARITNTSFGGKFYVDSLSDSDGPASTFLDLQRHNVQLILEGFSK
ncbi:MULTISPECIES: metal ABC transporter substrate-binding protein [Prochlorococcus]|uniref:ABC-type Mn2+/Zn2+ transport system periplasmic component n=1 Tax=Prochlorococcus marinus (strain SARG / CCMP1375 / SS120) TaxID=167539 RepID=Q7VBN2_PROMA|nr:MULTISPECIES: metal ABC transporter substrate-binding protein [Prochlorococcus]AAQ00105.1 ABC-type Mn2+/Zn2+ transport system periplasmic component [Prochlorococcus marinus subsp. marinus str. CCMP1375]KGG13901.1 Manganese ABC transporter [Prochlorococcus marinus str. LG]KGG19034.1 Manganese ABC transporter [Prochlorococcus marinus str. SS2]KGG23426.1 Manganese ABC transporter [Prochlorococcus marinus str. SS35]KGG32338.1 Manganese ABC transporter [Prochlorococcus marinus str. SS51]